MKTLQEFMNESISGLNLFTREERQVIKTLTKGKNFSNVQIRGPWTDLEFHSTNKAASFDYRIIKNTVKDGLAYLITGIKINMKTGSESATKDITSASFADADLKQLTKMIKGL